MWLCSTPSSIVELRRPRRRNKAFGWMKNEGDSEKRRYMIPDCCCEYGKSGLIRSRRRIRNDERAFLELRELSDCSIAMFFLPSLSQVGIVNTSVVFGACSG